MNWLDIIIIIVVLAAALVGFKIGIIKAVMSLVGVVVGVVLAGQYYAELAGLLTFIDQESLAKIVAFAIILLLVMLVAAVAAWLLKAVISVVMLGWLDKVGGAVLGLFLGMIFCGALLTIWAKTEIATGPVLASAMSGFLLDAFPLVLGLLPAEFDSVRAFFE